MSNDQCESQASFKRPPFPPEIDPAKIAKKRVSRLRDPSMINSRGPNCFLIYRTYYTSVNALSRSRKSNRIHMTTLSAIIAESWKKEPSVVKDYYRHLATQIEIEMCKQRRQNEIHIVNCEDVVKDINMTTNQYNESPTFRKKNADNTYGRK
ncbi:18539_t:CDS:1 [Acaulospora morrowiae]|uniref:18539_t:CDS:1 n=1 Tax=Acaulospora morrowiae TaxID=94023 RepID=A0A9N9C774_9GLOM|nr:18539_t:CDS:1 [Acaulospora morrowiae]